MVPACLPITTDFFPDKRSLKNDYVMSCYTLLPEDQGEHLLHHRVCYRGGDDLRNHIPFSTQRVLQELICQRLQQGFQLILMQRPLVAIQTQGSLVGSSQKQTKTGSEGSSEVTSYTLSIGRIFHSLVIERDNEVTVTQYRPRHPYTVRDYHYCYRFRAPDNETFGVSWVDFTSERLENYNWNYLDNYICLRGEVDGRDELRDTHKFWRFRLLILPNICQSITKRIIETSETGNQTLRCLGAYRESNNQDRLVIFEGFLKFMAILSKIKGYPAAQVSKNSNSNSRRFSTPQGGVQSPRERLGSSGSNERTRINSGQSNSSRDTIDGASHSTTIQVTSPKHPRSIFSGLGNLGASLGSRKSTSLNLLEIIEKFKSHT